MHVKTRETCCRIPIEQQLLTRQKTRNGGEQGEEIKTFSLRVCCILGQTLWKLYTQRFLDH